MMFAPSLLITYMAACFVFSIVPRPVGDCGAGQLVVARHGGGILDDTWHRTIDVFR